MDWLLLLLLPFAAWGLGIAGFVRTRRLRAEVAELRLMLLAAGIPAAAARPGAAFEGAAPVQSDARARPWDAARGRGAVPGNEASGDAAPAGNVPGGDVPGGAFPGGSGPGAPDAEPAAEMPPPAPAPPRRGLEELLTLRWGVWLGAAALLLAAVFLVRTALEEGWLGPAERCAGAVLLGFTLMAAAEAVRRRGAGPSEAGDGAGAGDAPGADGPAPSPSPARSGADWPDQVPGALAAGGVAALFAASYSAGALYGLLGPGLGFAFMAFSGVLGLPLALRFGPVVGAVGLAAAFVTPALAGSEDPSFPGLFAYLLVVTAAAMATVRFTGWAWLGWCAALAGAFWAFAGAVSAPAGLDAWAPALFVPAAAALFVWVLPSAALDHPAGRLLSWVPFGVLGLASLLPAVLSSFGEASVAQAASVLLLGPVAVVRAATEPRLGRLPWLAAALGLLLVTGWALPPDWGSGAEAVMADGEVLALLGGTVLPEALRPYLLAAGLLAAVNLAAGLAMEGRSDTPRQASGWAGLAALVPVVALALAYARVRGLATDGRWALAAAGLAAVSVAAAARSVRGGRMPAAGAHAAAAVAALALGCAALLRDQWLSVAVALLLPPLAVIERRTGLEALRRVSTAVAAVVLVRLLLNPAVLDYGLGSAPVVNGLLVAYGLPALSFALAARSFLRRGDDRHVAVLEAGAAALLTALVALELRHAASGGDLRRADAGFAEIALQVAALAVLAGAALAAHRRFGRPVAGWAWRLLGAAALAGEAGLLAFNPAFTGATVGASALFNALLPAYAVPALFFGLAASAPESAKPRTLRPLLGAAALAGALFWVTLEIRRGFHGDALDLDGEPVLPAELWAWSGAWILLGAAALLAGLRRGVPALRLAGLGLVGLTAAKVFLVDVAQLGGLWRVLSFLGLGVALIGLGGAYRRLLPGAGRPSLPGG